MNAVREIEVTSWQKFERRVDDLSEGRSEPPWFRGQSEAWPLRPRLLRHLRRRGLTDPREALEIENLAGLDFKRAAHLYLPTARLMQLSEAERGGMGLVAWWSIMRHHGAPTRLLDWSRSPFVAAYFASESSLVEGLRPAGVVWVLDYGTLRNVMDGTFAPKDGATRIVDDLLRAPDAPNDILPIFHMMPTERMLVQQGCFTVCRNVLGDHGEIIEQAASPALTRLIIPDTVKAEFRRRLRQINLTAHSMFGDLDGLGRHTDENVARLVDRHVESPATVRPSADP